MRQSKATKTRLQAQLELLILGTINSGENSEELEDSDGGMATAVEALGSEVRSPG